MTKLSPERRSEILFGNIEKSDCGVIALQAVTGLEREEAERLAAEFAGYKSDGDDAGTPRSGLPVLLSKLGYSVTNLSWPEIERQTAATFAVTHEYGVFLIYTPTHVMALVEGDLLNSRSFFHDPLEMAIKVEPPSGARRIAL